MKHAYNLMIMRTIFLVFFVQTTILAQENLILPNPFSAFERTEGSYRSIIPNRTASYDMGTDYIGIRFARVVSEESITGGIAYFFAPTVEYEGDDCFSIDYSFMGSKMVLLTDGDDLFFNRNQDTIRINTLATVGEEWLVYQDETVIIHGSVLSHEPQEFLGTTDSVKTIGFEAFDMDMNSVDHQVNSLTLELSKSHGLVKALYFLEFPHTEAVYYYPGTGLREIELVGISNPDLGIVNLTWNKVHDHQPGDELHIKRIISGMESQSVTNRIDHYLARTEVDGQVVYTIERKAMTTHHEWGGETTQTFLHDTITVTIGENEDFDHYAGEPKFVGDYDVNVHLQQGNSKTMNELMYWFQYSCWEEAHCDGGCYFYRYTLGLGGPYYSGGDDATWSTSRQLVYYKKGDVIWGNPLIITSVDEAKPQTMVKVFPNPTKEDFSIEVNADILPAVMEVRDMSGKIVLQQTLEHSREVINARTLPPGVYLYRIISRQGKTYTGRLVKL